MDVHQVDVTDKRNALVPREGKKMNNKTKWAGLSALTTLVLGLAMITPGYAEPPNGQPPLTAPPSRPASTPGPSPVLVVVAHPDDDTLATGVTLAKHAGQNVTVLILTSGEASHALDTVNTRLVSEQSPLAPLTQAQFAQAREDEATRAIAELDPTAQVHFARLPDGQLTTATAKQAIATMADQITFGPVRLKGHSYLSAVEPHPDHRAIGQAIQALGADNPYRFADRRHYVLPHSWGYTGTLPAKAWEYPNNPAMTAQVLAACAVYADWNPPASYAIGAQSTPGYFATLTATPKALVHQ